MPDAVQIHATALCHSKAVGAGSRVGAYATVAADAVLGTDCLVEDGATVGPGVTLGDRVEVGAGARLVADVKVGPNAVVGPNATVAAGVAIGRGAILAPGAAVTASVPANAVVSGNPAVIVDYTGERPSMRARDGAVPATGRNGAPTATAVPGVVIHPLTRAVDLRGSLMAIEFDELPFVPRRIFTVYDVPSELVRGSHAHVQCEQFLVCLAGSINCMVDDGTDRDEVRLESPDVGLHIPAMVWGTQYKHTHDAVLLVLASEPYRAEDYIRDYDEFLATRRAYSDSSSH